MDIAIIGAQGHLGSALLQRLKVIAPDDVRLHPTADKEHNVAIASSADAVVIVVQPRYVPDVLREVEPHLRETARVVSFAAMVSLASVSAFSKRPSARMLVDPWWNISAWIPGEDFSTTGLEFLFEKLTHKTPLQVRTDAEVDQMSVLISYIFAASLLQRAGEIDAHEHLRFLSEHPLVCVPPEKLARFAPEGDVVKQFGTLATKGGITERIIRELRTRPNLEPKLVFEKALRSLYLA